MENRKKQKGRIFVWLQQFLQAFFESTTGFNDVATIKPAINASAALLNSGVFSVEEPGGLDEKAGAVGVADFGVSEET